MGRAIKSKTDTLKSQKKHLQAAFECIRAREDKLYRIPAFPQRKDKCQSRTMLLRSHQDKVLAYGQ